MADAPAATQAAALAALEKRAKKAEGKLATVGVIKVRPLPRRVLVFICECQ